MDNRWLLSCYSAKIILLWTGTLTTAVIVKMFFFQTILEFASSEVPRIYGSLQTWLAPPYIYFVVNCIIITIAATSHFQSDINCAPSSVSTYSNIKTTSTKMEPVVQLTEEYKSGPAVMTPEDYGVAEPFGEVVVTDQSAAVDEPQDEEEEEEEEEEEKEEEKEEFVISRSNRRGTGEEKPPVSSRFGSRKSIKPAPDGKALGVARPKKSETLESTWKMITDGRAMPLARHLKKSDTWETAGTHRGRANRDKSSMKKRSKTFQDITQRDASPSLIAIGSSGSGKLRKESSWSRDELNKRVEAFINKFNQEMRLQRQQSEQHYWNVVNNRSVTAAAATQ